MVAKPKNAAENLAKNLIINEQIPLDLPHRTALGREDFLVATCNEEAIKWIDAWPDWPAISLIVYGPESCGKTHLASVWQERAGASYINAGDVQENLLDHVLEMPAPYMLDNADEVTDEVALFHLYNKVFNEKSWILMTAHLPPKQWNLQLKDLQSRLYSLPAVEIYPPDESVLAAVFLKLLDDRQLKVDEGVIFYILPRIERSFAAVNEAVEKLDLAAMQEQRRITVPLAKQVLGI